MGQGIFALPGNKPTDTGFNMGNWTNFAPKGYKSGQIDPVKTGGQKIGGGARFSACRRHYKPNQRRRRLVQQFLPPQTAHKPVRGSAQLTTKPTVAENKLKDLKSKFPIDVTTGVDQEGPRGHK